MGDYISRDEAIFAIDGELLDSLSEGMAKEILEMLPAADVVERKKGKWLMSPDGWAYCSICESFPEGMMGLSNYCPNCGADMRT